MSARPSARVIVRRATSHELRAVAALAQRVFDTVADEQSEEGRATYARYADAGAVMARTDDHDHWVAVPADAPEADFVGILEVRGGTHVSMLFVDPAWQGRGVARALLEGAFGPPDAWPALTLNSAPGAVPVYARLGFVPTEAMREHDGLRFLPMRRAGTDARA